LLAPEKSRFSMRFSLPETPKAAFLEVSHLASQGPDGEGVSPVTIMANGKAVVEDWNVGQTKYSETRWAIGNKLQSGQNQIEWRAGRLQTHYCLRRVRVLVVYDHPVEVRFAVPKVYDNSWPGGVWEVESEIVVATAAAMTDSVRVDVGSVVVFAPCKNSVHSVFTSFTTPKNQSEVYCKRTNR
jgi:hypothetical protein